MKLKRSLPILLLAVLMQACVITSFYPLYTKDVLIRDDRLIGTWKASLGELDENKDLSDNDILIWEVTFPPKTKKSFKEGTFFNPAPERKNDFTYHAKIYPKGQPGNYGKFELHLIKLDDKYLIDLYPKDWGGADNYLLSNLLVPTHSFARIKLGDTIKIAWYNSEWLEDLFDQNKIRIRHERSNQILLTARPKELQKFIKKFDTIDLDNLESPGNEDIVGLYNVLEPFNP